MRSELDEARRTELIEALQGFYLTELDEEISAFRAEQVVTFLLRLAGPQLYNQAVQDARAFMQQKLDDLEGEVYFPEGSP